MQFDKLYIEEIVNKQRNNSEPMLILPDIRPKKPTIEMLKEFPKESIFAHGYAETLHPWFNNIQQPDGITISSDTLSLDIPLSKYRLVKWVAFRGYAHDWCIYHSNDANLNPNNYLDGDGHLLSSWAGVMRHGAKLHQGEEIRRLIPCTDDAFNMYRH